MISSISGDSSVQVSQPCPLISSSSMSWCLRPFILAAIVWPSIAYDIRVSFDHKTQRYSFRDGAGNLYPKGNAVLAGVNHDVWYVPKGQAVFTCENCQGANMPCYNYEFHPEGTDSCHEIAAFSHVMNFDAAYNGRHVKGGGSRTELVVGSSIPEAAPGIVPAFVVTLTHATPSTNGRN